MKIITIKRTNKKNSNDLEGLLIGKHHKKKKTNKINQKEIKERYETLMPQFIVWEKIN